MILVFGSINVDLVFRPQRLPQPGETVLSEAMHVECGGKGANQAVAAARAQGPGAAPVVMAGAVGGDAFAETAIRDLRAAGVDLSHLQRSPRSTGCAAIVVDAAGQNEIIVASGANLDLAQAPVPDELLGPDTILLLQNEVAEAQNQALARRARARGASVVLNAAPARALDTAAWAGLLSLLVVNEGEAALIAGALDDAALARLAEALGAPVLVTLGADGARAIHPDGSVLAGPALSLPQVVDTTAAGDTYVGALAVALREGMALAEAMRFAGVAGGLACLVPGAQTSAPDRAAILARLGDLAAPAAV
ncbi:MAG TPA: PfkB family carbohydrate kinase [Microvirga sp.]|jgi:ribokinase